MIKTCSKCELTKDIEEFHIISRKTGRRNAQCKVCYAQYHKEYYKKNGTRTLEKNKEYEERNARYIFTYLLTHPCVDCGEKDPIVLQFDHQKDKIKSISEMIRQKNSIEKMNLEISKCEVRCANCHQRRTAKQFNWFKMSL